MLMATLEEVHKPSRRLDVSKEEMLDSTILGLPQLNLATPLQAQATPRQGIAVPALARKTHLVSPISPDRRAIIPPTQA